MSDWKVILTDNKLPMILIDDFSALDLYKMTVAGKIEWDDIPTPKQKTLIDAQIVDIDGNSLPRIRLVYHKVSFLPSEDEKPVNQEFDDKTKMAFLNWMVREN